MENILTIAIQSVQRSKLAFCKFITANDTGTSGAHQSGFYLHKSAWPLFFESPGVKGTNKDIHVTIKWQNSFETDSRAIYYGQGSRNEYRLTRFGRKFPFFEDENVGDLLIISKLHKDYYEGFVLSTSEDIDDFFAELNLSPTQTNGIIPKQFETNSESLLFECFETFVKSLSEEFPSTHDLSLNARLCYQTSFKKGIKDVRRNPDHELLKWLDAEFQLFKTIEESRYQHQIKKAFASVEELITTANTILNRRKSRAGKSLEHHLAEVFNIFELSYSSQAVTEGNKKPDFLFPDSDAYHSSRYDSGKLFMLASKTTCKDRWRQILNEADKIEIKHLFTLQQGISENQLNEMYRHNVKLVVPKSYIDSFPRSYREKILSLDNFLNIITASQRK